MKALRLSEDIIPIGEFKARASSVLRRLKTENRPIVITQHGRPAGVLIPMSDYESMTERDRFVHAVNEGLADAKAGRLLTSEQVRAELDREFGPLSDDT